MRLWRLCVWVALTGLGVHGLWAHAQSTEPGLTQQHAQARQQQDDLRARIAALQETMAAQEAQHRDVTKALKTSESTISALQREMTALRQQTQAVQSELTRLHDLSAQHAQTLAQQRHALAQQLRAQYASGLSPWVALLSGKDPHVIGRDLGYLGYLSRAQSQTVRDIQQTLSTQENLRAQVQDKHQALAQLEKTTQARVRTLQKQQQTRQQILQRLSNQLSDQRAQVARLERDAQRLGRLVTLLESALAAPAQAEPQGEYRGLTARVPYPVKGQVQGQFGTDRPEGGVWRGVVMRAAEGTQVRAIAPGRVVYAQWLSGFGNLMIVDHGAQYMSVYAYNQSLLHEVGDTVRTGQPLALVGATGGQVEPGLYFEIRHHGVPVDPLPWLQP